MTVNENTPFRSNERRHPTRVADDLRQLATDLPDHADLLIEAYGALYRAAAIVATVKASVRGG